MTESSLAYTAERFVSDAFICMNSTPSSPLLPLQESNFLKTLLNMLVDIYAGMSFLTDVEYKTGLLILMCKQGSSQQSLLLGLKVDQCTSMRF